MPCVKPLRATPVTKHTSVGGEQIPADHRLKSPLNLPPGLRAESELRRDLVATLAKNETCETNLSFLGAGVPPPAPTWGAMLQKGYPYLDSAPWVAIAPGAAVFLTVLGFNLLGDGLRAVLSPRRA